MTIIILNNMIYVGLLSTGSRYVKSFLIQLICTAYMAASLVVTRGHQSTKTSVRCISSRQQRKVTLLLLATNNLLKSLSNGSSEFYHLLFFMQGLLLLWSLIPSPENTGTFPENSREIGLRKKANALPLLQLSGLSTPW